MTSKAQTNDNNETTLKHHLAEAMPVDTDTPTPQQADPASLVKKAGLSPSLLSTNNILQLQRILGNQVVGRLIAQRQMSTIHAEGTQTIDKETNTVSQEKSEEVQNKLSRQQLSLSPAPQAEIHNTSINDGYHNSVIQRVIEINNKSYNLSNESEFRKEQKEHIAGIEHGLGKADIDMKDRTIEAALADQRKLVVTISHEGSKTFYNVHTEDTLVKRTEGKAVRSAGRIPVYIERPKSGVEEIEISGLITCVGVLIEVIGEDGPTGAAGGHFVTPEMFDGEKSELTQDGEKFVNTITNLVDQQKGIMKGFSFYVSNDRDGHTTKAIDLLNNRFQSKGYQGSNDEIMTDGHLTYILPHKGDPDVKGIL